ncbi:DUF4214 domain-containing protein [Methylobacterium sp. WL103]|uniref:DUF4214 domain-containing protein n=1 Tax=unclassified Methylobacterium TaxID=2615210 RepID=UPI0011CC2C9D|nr:MULTISPECIES: DUF4214 domain-containing protein [unclassified Methylobacterium]TXM64651.1 DUF4214 domain-containing protein [Methylobacterium sp. WL120]TXN05831.1 DUF4214 domain-containing protein [Methylobacterium sp. WL103]
MALSINLGLLGGGSSPSNSAGGLLNLNLDPLLNLNVGAGGASTTGTTASSSTINLGLDLGTGSTSHDGGLLGGLFGGGTATGTTGLIPGGISGIGQTIIDLTGSLLGGTGTGTGGTGSIPTNAGTPGLTITGTSASETLQGTAGNDTFSALGGNDVIFGRGGNDVVDGGTGIDTFVTNGAITQFNAAAQNGVLALQNTSTGEISYTANVERIYFTDNKVLALDFNGDAGQAYRLYQAALDRAPDAVGLKYHVTHLDQGQSLHDDAQSFLTSPEFNQKYGSNLTDQQFVNALYSNTLHRAPDATGFAYWTNNLANHTMDRASVLVGFSESPENHNQTDHQLQNGILLDYGVA